MVGRPSRRSRCLGRFDGIVATLKTTASRRTLFDFFFYLDGKEYDYRVAGEGKTIRLCEGLKPAGSG